jgi:hypothetical protein
MDAGTAHLQIQEYGKKRSLCNLLVSLRSVFVIISFVTHYHLNEFTLEVNYVGKLQVFSFHVNFSTCNGNAIQ